MKIIIAGGGTGGHLYPGIAIARELLAGPGNEVQFVGTEQGIEARVLPREGLPVRFIDVGKLKGMGAASVLWTVAKMPRSILQSLRLLRSFRPDAVIGVGGYASGPVALAALLLRLPLVLVEPNSYPGLVNRVLGKAATMVVLSFPGEDRRGFFTERRTFRTGPLVRAGIESGDRERTLHEFGLEPGRFTVLVTGGSGGAHAVNMALKDAARRIAAVPGIQVLHQTGEKDRQEVAAAYREAGVRAAVVPYLHDMAGAYAAADLVVSRSGATTVAELAVCGKRAVLVPYPYAADNHQEHNARTLAETGAAEVIIQRDLTPERIAEIIRLRAGERKEPPRRMKTTAAREIVRICTDHVRKN